MGYLSGSIESPWIFHSICRLKSAVRGLRDYAKASAEPHTLFGSYAGYGFKELQHLARALQDSCFAKLTPPTKSLRHFDELSSETTHKIER